MNKYLTDANDARPFQVTGQRLWKIAVVVWAYAVFIMLPAFILLTAWGQDEPANWSLMLWVGVPLLLYIPYARREMARLTAPALKAD